MTMFYDQTDESSLRRGDLIRIKPGLTSVIWTFEEWDLYWNLGIRNSMSQLHVDSVVLILSFYKAHLHRIGCLILCEHGPVLMRIEDLGAHGKL